MRHALTAVAGVLLTVFIIAGTMFGANASSGDEPQGCVISIAGIKVCGTLLGQPLPEVATVTVPPVTLPPVTVTDVVTVRPDPIRVTETIRPEPVRVTETVTAPPVPQPTATVTETQVVGEPNRSDNTPSEPQATVTETVRPNGQPVPTVTETVTPEPEQVTRQSDEQSGTVEPNNDDSFFSPDIDFGDDTVTAGEAGVGLLGALLIFALVVAGMYYGFTRGQAVANREDAYFLRSMLDRSKTS
jgi:hypothetical protein